MSNSLFVDDGYTCVKKLDAVPGIYPTVEFIYRPALSKVRAELGIASGSNSAARVEDAEADIVARHTVSVNGLAIDKDKALKLKPALRQNLLNLVLGYVGSDEEKADLKN